MEFVKFPFSLYRNDPNLGPSADRRTPTCSPEEESALRAHPPAVETFWARRDGKLVGTISAMVNDLHNEVHHELMGSFGFFETIV